MLKLIQRRATKNELVKKVQEEVKKIRFHTHNHRKSMFVQLYALSVLLLTKPDSTWQNQFNLLQIKSE